MEECAFKLGGATQIVSTHTHQILYEMEECAFKLGGPTQIVSTSEWRLHHDRLRYPEISVNASESVRES